MFVEHQYLESFQHKDGNNKLNINISLNSQKTEKIQKVP